MAPSSPLTAPARLALPLLLTVSGLLTGCSDDGTLFAEDGVWSVIKYDLQGQQSYNPLTTPTRKDGFLLRFDTDKKIVAAASCQSSDDAAVMKPGRIDSTSCKTTTTSPPADWYCNCFTYTFDGDVQRWLRFQSGAPMKVPGPAPDAKPPKETVGDSEPTGGETSVTPHVVIAQDDPEQVQATWVLQPLPEGLFNSNGDLSRYVVQNKTASLFPMKCSAQCQI